MININKHLVFLKTQTRESLTELDMGSKGLSKFPEARSFHV